MRRKLQFDELKGALTGLLILGAILVPAGLYLVRETLVSHAAVDGLDESQKAITDQLGAFIKVERLLGYTHFIHNFKNGVLRRDPSRLLLAKADIAEARQVLQQLLAFNAAMAAPVADLTRTLNEYDRKADLAGELIARGVAATDIDAAVKVDDTTAGAALFTIEEEITFARLVLVRDFGRQHALQQRTRNVAIVTAVGLIATALTLVWLYLLISRQSRALLATRERLADISRQFVGNVNGGAVDDDGSGDVRKLETVLLRLSQKIAEKQRALIEHTKSIEAANEELSRFAYVASHDLQEPLRKIQSNIDLIHLRYGDDLDEDLQQRMGRIARSATSMRQLIDDLLDYSRRGRQPLSLAPVDLKALIDKTIVQSSDMFDEKHGGMINEMQGETVVSGDQAMLAQVFKNIFENAAKYARPDQPPTVLVSSNSNGTSVTLRFADNGIGFDAQYAEEIFKPFIRLHGKGAYPGSGIGLSIVSKIVERHGGSVTASPNDLGGATFEVTLPTAGPQDTGV